MRRFAFALVGFCLAFAAGCSPAAEKAQPSAAAAPSPALWRISDADSTVWLFGTVHLLPEDFAWRNARIDSALASADVLVTETDIDPEGAEALQALAVRYGTEPRNRTIGALIESGVIDTDVRVELDKQRRANALPAGQLYYVRPWLAALQLSVAHAAKYGHHSEAGVETALLETAHAQNKTLETLETPEQQIRTLADLSPRDELAFLRATLREMNEPQDMLAELDQAWVSGDTHRLAALTEADLRDAGDGAYDALITRRNTAWVPQIRAMLAGDRDYFVAVGAAHLVGDNSVIARLRAAGVHVEGP